MAAVSRWSDTQKQASHTPRLFPINERRTKIGTKVAITRFPGLMDLFIQSRAAVQVLIKYVERTIETINYVCTERMLITCLVKHLKVLFIARFFSYK